MCASVVSLVGGIAFEITSLVKGNSDANDCTAHSGSVDKVHWTVFANGSHCDTTAQLNTIAGAIANYMRAQDSKVCGVHCIKLTHGGTWQGYISLAANGENLDTYYCGSAFSFGNCGSDGESDV